MENKNEEEKEEQKVWDSSGGRKICPKCGEEMPYYIYDCPKCHYDFN